MPSATIAGLVVHRNWRDDPALLAAVRRCFTWPPGEDRATGCLYAPADGTGWPPPLAAIGPDLLGALEETVGTRFPICAFQAYRAGAGCGWHADAPFAAQAILSLGVTRTFGWRRNDGSDEEQALVSHGDLVVMPDGFQRDWQHRVPEDGTEGERIALVFRVPAAKES
jgi:alkylated DNA repair dioxygenase AlkB